ncbi:MAG: endonuclease VII domain-containing protein [Chlamydiia bacterium]
MDRKSYNQQYYLKNKQKIIAQSSEWAKNNKEKRAIIGRNSHTKKKYGITFKDEQALKLAQNNKCAICKNVLGEGHQVHIDHSHSTGKIRGVLCRYCNILLGQAKDSIEILQSAQDYLKKYT